MTTTTSPLSAIRVTGCWSYKKKHMMMIPSIQSVALVPSEIELSLRNKSWFTVCYQTFRGSETEGSESDQGRGGWISLLALMEGRNVKQPFSNKSIVFRSE